MGGKLCQGPSFGHDERLDKPDSRWEPDRYNKSNTIQFIQPQSFRTAPNTAVANQTQSTWMLRGRKLFLATAAVGLGGLGTLGMISSASADGGGPCLDEGNGDGWGVNPETNEGCLISGFTTGEICLDDDGDGRGFNPALNDTCELDGHPDHESDPGEPRQPEPEPAELEQRQPVPEPEPEPEPQPVGSQDCVDEGDGDPWGVNPTTNDGCWIEGIDLSTCEESGSVFECPDGETYPADPSNEPYEGDAETDSSTYYSAHELEFDDDYSPGSDHETAEQPLTRDAMCAEHGASASYYSSDGSFAGCSVCLDHVAPIQDGFGPDDDFEHSGFTECYNVDPETGERLPFMPIRPNPVNVDRDTNDRDTNESDGSSSATASSPHVIWTPDNVKVHYDRDKVTIIGGNEHTDAPYIYLADGHGEGHGTKLIGDPVPICEQGIESDIDGDGYGSENGRTCYAGVVADASSSQPPSLISRGEQLASEGPSTLSPCRPDTSTGDPGICSDDDGFCRPFGADVRYIRDPCWQYPIRPMPEIVGSNPDRATPPELARCRSIENTELTFGHGICSDDAGTCRPYGTDVEYFMSPCWQYPVAPIDLTGIGQLDDRTPGKDDYASVVDRVCQDSFGGQIRSDDGACVIDCVTPLGLSAAFGEEKTRNHAADNQGANCSEIFF